MTGIPVYGIVLHGLGDGRPAPADWASWTLTQSHAACDDRAGMSVDGHAARIGMPGAGEFVLDRAGRQIDLRSAVHWEPEALIHPALAPAAAVVAHWAGRASLHAAGVVRGGQAWGLLGEGGAGKSTTAAALTRRGWRLLTDDLLVVDGDVAFGGPAAVDLREEASARFGGRPLGRIGARSRWRLTMPPAPLSAPVAGWVVLEWSEDLPAVEPVAVADRVALLGQHAGLPPAAEHLLELADRPMLRFSRARDLARLSEALTVLDAAMSG